MLGAKSKSSTSVFVGLATQMHEAYRAREKTAVAFSLSVIENNKMRLQPELMKKCDRRRSGSNKKHRDTIHVWYLYDKKKKGSRLLFFFLFSARALRFLPRAA